MESNFEFCLKQNYTVNTSAHSCGTKSNIYWKPVESTTTENSEYERENFNEGFGRVLTRYQIDESSHILR